MGQLLLEDTSWFGPNWKALADEYNAIVAGKPWPPEDEKKKKKKKDPDGKERPEKPKPKKDKDEFLNNDLRKGIEIYLRVTQESTQDIIVESIKKYGVNERRNPCIIYVAGIKNGKRPFLASKYEDHINFLLQSFLNKTLTYSYLPMDLIYNLGLYNRSLDDFKWCLANVPVYYNQDYIQQNFKNPKVIKTKEFYDDKGILKSNDDIENLIEGWKKDNEPDGSPDKEEEMPLYGGINNDLINKFDKLTTPDERTAFVKKYVFSMKKFKDLFGVREVILENLLISSLNPKKNQFLDFILKIPFKMEDTKQYREKIRYVYESFKLKKLKLTLEVLMNESLYDRSDKDFRYTLNVFNTLSQSDKIAAYFKDVSKVNTAELMDGDVIKPAGLHKGPGDTIYNIIEAWADGNEYTAAETAERLKKAEEEKEKKKDKDNDDGTSGGDDKSQDGDSKETTATTAEYVMEDVVPQEKWTYETFKQLIEKIFKLSSKVSPKGKKEEYLNKVYVALEYPKLVETSYLQEVQQTKNKILNKSPDDITESDITTFGDPINTPDVPIPVRVIEDGSTKDQVSGVFVFHKFIPLTKEKIGEIKKISARYRNAMETKTFTPAGDKTIDSLKGIVAVLDQVG